MGFDREIDLKRQHHLVVAFGGALGNQRGATAAKDEFGDGRVEYVIEEH